MKRLKQWIIDILLEVGIKQVERQAELNEAIWAKSTLAGIELRFKLEAKHRLENDLMLVERDLKHLEQVVVDELETGSEAEEYNAELEVVSATRLQLLPRIDALDREVLKIKQP